MLTRPDAFALLSGSQDVYDLVWAVALTHHKKNQDYATKEDPFKNFRAGEDIGIPAYKMAMLRLLEKTARIKNLETKTEIATEETVDETLIDLAVLALITAVLKRET
jgi:hypothetical protein